MHGQNFQEALKHITVRPLSKYFDQDFPTPYSYGDFTTLMHIYKYSNIGAVPNWKKKQNQTQHQNHKKSGLLRVKAEGAHMTAQKSLSHFSPFTEHCI